MTNEELTKMIVEISRDIFGKPFRHQGVFNKRLRTTGGRYLLRSHNIEINPASYEKFGGNELIGIIKHELCHYHLHLEGKGYKHRDKDFRELLQETGSPRFCSLLVEKRRKTAGFHLYECISCKTEFPRKIRMDTAKYRCGRCSGKLRVKREKSL